MAITNRQFQNKIYFLFNGYIRPLEAYIKHTVKLRFRCVKGHVFTASPASVYHHRGNGCPICLKENIINRNSQIFKDLVNIIAPGYKVLGQYFSNDTNIKMKCPYDHIFYVRPSNFKNGLRCKKCRAKKNRKNYIHKFSIYVTKITNGSYEVLGDWVKRYDQIKIKIKCPYGHIFYTYPSDFKRGHWCKYCSRQQLSEKYKHSDKWFKTQVKLYSNNEYIVLGRYIGCDKKILFKHMICGKTFRMAPSHFLEGQRCPRCRYIRSSKTSKNNQSKRFKKYAKSRGYRVLGKYINTYHSVKCICPFSHICYVKPINFYQGSMCDKCRYIKKCTPKSTAWYTHKVYNLTHGEYTVVSKYNGCRSLVTLRHNKCGHIFKVIPNYFNVGGSKCPYCNMSNGENEIDNYLNFHRIKFVYGYITNIKYKKYLHFDFWDPSSRIAIEFDGKQHFRPIAFSHKKTYCETIEDFNDLWTRDRIKDDYCKSHNIILIRIKYTHYYNNDIENYLDKYLLPLVKSKELVTN